MINQKKYYEVVGIFKSIEELNESVDELFSIGFNQSSLSVLSRNQINKQKDKEAVESVASLADNRETLRTSFQAEENISLAEGAIISGLMYIGGVGTSAVVIITKGADSNLFLASAIGIIATIIGIILAIMLNKYHKQYIEYQLRNGGLILWVHLKEKSQSHDVIKILKFYNATKIHTSSYIYTTHIDL